MPNVPRQPAIPCLVIFLSVLMLGPGCRSNKVDWGARVGAYSFDQAVVELGPPDKQATLTDGTRVADWIMRRGGYRRVGAGGYYGYGPYGYSGYPVVTDHYVPDSMLRLVFDDDDNLQGWKKLAR
jgi:hypothetical protein